MTRPRYWRKRLLLYLIPLLIGLAGIRFSQEFDNLAVRAVVVLLSVAVPLFGAGNLLARFRFSRIERLALFVGVVLLLLGAAVSVSGFSDSLVEKQVAPVDVANFSRLLGMSSVFFGLFVILIALVRTGEDIEEYGERFWRLVEHMGDGFLLVSGQDRVFLVNHQFLDMFGLQEDQVLGQSFSALIALPPQKAAPEDPSLGREFEVSRPVAGDERRFWFKLRPMLDRAGRSTATLATVRDITEYHRLTERVERYAAGLQELVDQQTQKLHLSEERLRQLLLSMNEGFLTVDAAHHIRFLNERICQLLGARQEDLMGRDIFDFVDASGRRKLLSLLTRGVPLRAMHGRQEIDLLDGEGNVVPTVLSVASLRDPVAGEMLYSLVVTGVAELKQMQRQLEARARELERANDELRTHDRAKDSFLSNVSHELRTPLSTIQGYIEMLQSGTLGHLEEPQRAALSVMARNAERIIGHINEMIEFSRMEIRGVRLDVDLFSASHLAEESLASIHPQALASAISVELHHQLKTDAVWADRPKMAQVLGILLNNAVKFTDRGGRISVLLEERAHHTLCLAVSDTGIGIAPEHQQQVFNKFYQVDSSKSRRYPGTGIGLSIANGIVQGHGGTIELASERGKGSTFTVTLPNRLFDFEDAPDALPAEGSVLILSASKAFHDTVAAIFERHGWDCRKAQDRGHAMKLCQERPPKLVLINADALEGTWQETVRDLRLEAGLDAVPVLLCTNNDTGAMPVPTALEPLHYCPKPFSARGLLEGANNALRSERLAGSGSDLGPEFEAGQPAARALIIDADPGFLEWFRLALRLRHIQAECVRTLQEGIAWAVEETPDVIFLDMDIPGTRGAEQVELLRRHELTRHTPVYLMTGLPATLELRADVAGVLHKPFTADDAAERVFAVFQKVVGHAVG